MSLEKVDISIIASKNPANITYLQLPSGPPYTLLVVNMDNSRVNVFDSDKHMVMITSH